MKIFFTFLALTISIFAANKLDLSSPLNELSNFKYENQFEEPVSIPKDTQLLIISFEKETGDFVNDYLDTKEPLYLLAQHAVFIADINRMPSIITSLFALPKLQKYKHPIYLHYEDQFENYIPYKEEQLILVHIKDEKVHSISYISTLKELKEVLK